MKKIFILSSFIFILTLSVGCRQRTVDYSAIPDTNDERVNNYNTAETRNLNTSPNDVTDMRTQNGTTQLSVSDTAFDGKSPNAVIYDGNYDGNVSDYLIRIRDIDNRLRTSIRDLDNVGINQTDTDYITKRRNYLRNYADAYNTALTDIRDINYPTEDSRYYDAVLNYYQTGYNTYYNLYSDYGDFTTYDDESRYLQGLDYDPYVFDEDVRRYYDDALDYYQIKPVVSNY